jgi:hypothetical protein
VQFPLKNQKFNEGILKYVLNRLNLPSPQVDTSSHSIRIKEATEKKEESKLGYVFYYTTSKKVPKNKTVPTVQKEYVSKLSEFTCDRLIYTLNIVWFFNSIPIINKTGINYVDDEIQFLSEYTFAKLCKKIIPNNDTNMFYLKDERNNEIITNLVTFSPSYCFGMKISVNLGRTNYSHSTLPQVAVKVFLPWDSKVSDSESGIKRKIETVVSNNDGMKYFNSLHNHVYSVKEDGTFLDYVETKMPTDSNLLPAAEWTIRIPRSSKVFNLLEITSQTLELNSYTLMPASIADDHAESVRRLITNPIILAVCARLNRTWTVEKTIISTSEKEKFVNSLGWGSTDFYIDGGKLNQPFVQQQNSETVSIYFLFVLLIMYLIYNSNSWLLGF